MPTRTDSSPKRLRPRTTAAAPPVGPFFGKMSALACAALLRRHSVGRLAFSFHDRVDIVPIHYVFDGPWIFGRTSPGTKLTVIRHNPWVAFEVDEQSGLFDWRSVVVHGTLHTLEPDDPPSRARAWRRGMSLLQRLVPETGGSDDPVPFRTVTFGIHVDSVSGRTASSTRPAARRKA
jgi:uncharacterized protein